MIWEPKNIKNYLRSLRYHQRQSQATGQTKTITRLLEAHRINVRPGRDTFSDTGVPLVSFLSLLDDPERLDRVSAVHLRFNALGCEERRLHRDVVAGACSA